MRFPSTRVDALAHTGLLCAAPTAVPLLIQPLYESYQASTAAGQESVPLLLGFLLAKRLGLYSLAITTVGLAALRSGDADPALGARLKSVTAEMIGPLPAADSMLAESEEIATALDRTSSSQQAAALPLLLGLVLAGSTAALMPAAPPSDDGPLQLSALLSALRPAFATLSALSTAGVSTLFCGAELQAILSAALVPAAVDTPAAGAGSTETDTDTALTGRQSALALGVAAALVALAYALPPAAAWPARNVVNACVAVGVARVLQLPQLPVVCAALGGLALYDAAGTAQATDAVSAAVSAANAAMGGGSGAVGGGGTGGLPAAPGFELLAAAPSPMESVAVSRLGAAWQPGLLTVAVNGRVTDALGLGDVCFPAILAGWARRFDLELAAGRAEALPKNSTATPAEDAASPTGGGYLGAALGGYAAGCVLLEVVPPELSRAALLFLVPPMVTAVIGRAILAGELGTATRSQRARGPRDPQG